MKLKTDWTNHLHKIRSIEVKKAFEFFGDRKFDKGLEFGAGDGYQTSLIYKKFNSFVSTDLNFERIKIKIPSVQYIKVDADNCKDFFTKQDFDIIFSSSFLEHLSNPYGFLKNSIEFLKNDGYAIHIVPNRFMKIAYILMFYPNLLILIIDRLAGLFRGKKIFRGEVGFSENNINKTKIPNTSKFDKFKKIFLPSIHGIYRSHYDEFLNWGDKEWSKMFINSGYEIVKKTKTSVHSGYGFGFDNIRKILEFLGFGSLTIYILKKHE